MRRRLRGLLALAGLSLAGAGCPAPVTCGEGTRIEGTRCVAPPQEAVDSGTADAAVPDAGGDAGSGEDAGSVVPDGGLAIEDPADPEPDCARVAAGPASAAPLPAALSAAHAAVRYFGLASTYAPVDEALAGALDEPGELSEGALHRYGAALAGVCVLKSGPAALPPAQVQQLAGNVVLVRPGSGALTLPSGAAAWALDLRELPSGPAADAALQTAIGRLLAVQVARSQQEVRIHLGPTDEYSSTPGAYDNALERFPLPAFSRTGTAARPLAVIVGPRLSPEAARAAGDLRLAGSAWLFGEPIAASVAESFWAGVHSRGVSYRAMNLWRDGARWPDQLPADRASAQLAAALAELPTLGAPPALSASAAARTALGVATPSKGRAANALTRGRTRAALIAAHGALRTFFPYFGVVGDRIDERLAEVLGQTGAAAPPDRRRLLQLAGRLGEAIRDGHNFIFDGTGETSPAGMLAVVLDNVGGEPVIASSRAPGFLAGDALVEVEGRAISSWLAEELPRTSAASDGYRFDLATRRLLELEGDTPFTVRAPDGGTRGVTATPQSYAELEAAFKQLQRRSGALTDLGAPDLYYLNLDGYSLDGQGSTCAAALAEAKSAVGMVLDMRGYPGEEGFTCLPQLLLGTASSPNFRVMRVSALGRLLEPPTHWTMTPGPGDRFTGPIVLLVGPTTVSAAETISTLLVDSGRLKRVLGRPSAATNGNITYLRLPAGLFFTFTGMEVTHVDGGVYHGVGIVPDQLVSPTAQELAVGRDTTLEAAIAALRAP